MTNIKYSKRFKLRNGERIDFCPECGQQIQLFKPALCPKDCDFLKKHQYLGKFFCLAHKNGEKELQRDIEGNAIMINGCAGGDIR